MLPLTSDTAYSGLDGTFGLDDYSDLVRVTTSSDASVTATTSSMLRAVGAIFDLGGLSTWTPREPVATLGDGVHLLNDGLTIAAAPSSARSFW